MTEVNYNPDVLSCLANLSNDEVFTPPEVANAMLDLLPQEIFENPQTTFLDPACKSGVFLREIAKRLIKGLEPKIPNLKKRIKHIFKNQLYGISITELTSLLSRRSVYCSKYANSKFSVCDFETSDGNIRFKKTQHLWINGKCLHCGASQAEYGIEKRGEDLETHAYEFIHTDYPEEIFKMKFDVIIGNPPYQMSDGGNGASAAPIYHKFVINAKKLKPRFLVMIIPARWYSGGKGLDEFRNEMINDTHIRYLADYRNSADCFAGVELKGGVCYFLWSRDNVGLCKVENFSGDNVISSIERYMKIDGSEIFVRRNDTIPILNKIQSFNEKSFSSLVSSRKPFGLSTDTYGHSEKSSNDIKIFQNGGTAFFSKSKIIKNLSWIDKNKIFISKAYGASEEFPHQILNKPILVGKDTCCSETYLVIGPFDNEKYSKNVYSYILTKFFRFLVCLIKNTQDATQKVYQFVPLQDFTSASDIDWSRPVPEIDKQLYAKYNLSQEEIDFIESMIRPMP